MSPNGSTPIPEASPRRTFTPADHGMDVVRSPRHASSRRRRRWLGAAGALLALAAVTILVARLRPAVPSVPRDSIWIDTVRRGEMIRQVRGLGTLVPEEIRWIAAATDARVERIVMFPGATVQPDTVLLVLSNPELQQSVLDADGAVKAAQARLVNLRAQLEGAVLERQSAYAKAEGDRETAVAQVEVDERLNQQGLVAAVELKKSQITAKELIAMCEIEKQRVEFNRQSVEPQIAIAQGDLDQAKAQAALRHSQFDALQVRAGMAGVLQQVPVEVGQRITAGTNLARVADPAKLKAQIKIPETQARDIEPGLPVSVDTRNGVIEGRVSRLDPAVDAGTVLTDVTFNGAPLPRGARPDLSVEGTVELERIPDTLIVNRPTFGREDSTVGLFRLSPDGTEATRVQVQLGRGSVNVVEIRSGLKAGDQIILSDTSAYDGAARIRIR
jgi:HlyD family secretion protein